MTSKKSPKIQGKHVGYTALALATVHMAVLILDFERYIYAWRNYLDNQDDPKALGHLVMAGITLGRDLG